MRSSCSYQRGLYLAAAHGQSAHDAFLLCLSRTSQTATLAHIRRATMNPRISTAACLALAVLASSGVGRSQHTAAPHAAGATPVSASSSSGSRQVSVSDPVYQMTAYTMEVPSNW